MQVRHSPSQRRGLRSLQILSPPLRHAGYVCGVESLRDCKQNLTRGRYTTAESDIMFGPDSRVTVTVVIRGRSWRCESTRILLAADIEGAGMMERENLVGAAVAHWIYGASTLVFVLRLLRMPEVEHWMGVGVLLAAFPLGYLLFKGPSLGRSALYYLQIGLMLAWLVVEFLLDYWPGMEFRETRWIVIPYVTLFFAGAGGMIGVAKLAGRGWTISAVILFLIMGVLTFVQRAVTGM